MLHFKNIGYLLSIALKEDVGSFIELQYRASYISPFLKMKRNCGSIVLFSEFQDWLTENLSTCLGVLI
jgi:hypothetical protein